MNRSPVGCICGTGRTGACTSKDERAWCAAFLDVAGRGRDIEGGFVRWSSDGRSSDLGIVVCSGGAVDARVGGGHDDGEVLFVLLARLEDKVTECALAALAPTKKKEESADES